MSCKVIRNISNLQSLPSPIFVQILDQGGNDCTQCGLSFKLLSDLITHQDNIEKLVRCSACDDRFTTTLGMKKHFGKVHAKYRPSRCNMCKKRFRNKYAAKRHMLQVHQETSRVSCATCGKVLYNKFSLTRHMQTCRELIKLANKQY